jgi:hypothetical protein
LGAAQLVAVADGVWVANMVGQRGIATRGSQSAGPPVRYEAIGECLGWVGVRAAELGAGVHLPRIGCGLAGGEWRHVEPLIVENLVRKGVLVTVYDVV